MHIADQPAAPPPPCLPAPAPSAPLQYNLIGVMDEETIRLREEVQEQIRALQDLKAMAAVYGDDISEPATNSREAVQVRTSLCLCLSASLFLSFSPPSGSVYLVRFL